METNSPESQKEITINEQDGFWRSLYKSLGLKSLKYPLPAHAQTIPYMLGGLTFATFMILFASGIYIAQFYNPNQISSYQSVVYLITSAPFGNFIRSIHYWSSNIVFILIIAHVTRVFISGSYKRPREFTWLMGVGLLLLTILFMFAGTMMSLGQEGIEALEHSSEIGVLLGPLALWFTSGFSASLPLIGRAYVAHISILPLLFIILITAHFYFIHVHNVSPKASKDATVGYADDESTVPFTAHMKKLAGWSFILIAIIAVLALLFPEALGRAGAAGVPLQEAKPRWMFLWLFGAEDVFGIKALLWAPATFFTLLAIVPFIDRSKYLSPRRRPWMMVYGAVIALVMIVLSVQALSAATNMKAMRAAKESANIPFIEKILPGKIAYAHDLVFLSFKPTTVISGGNVNLKGDGIHDSGTYDVYLDGPQKPIFMETATVPNGSDSFDINMNIPANIPGAMYTIEIKNVQTKTSYYAPLQLSVQPITMSGTTQYPKDSQRTIPKSEVPWIIGLIVVSFGIGVFLLKDKKQTKE